MQYRKNTFGRYSFYFLFILQGGMWNYDSDTSKGTSGRVYNSLVTNSSTVMTCYSDFPFPKDAPPFVPHKTYFKYLNVSNKHLIMFIYVLKSLQRCFTIVSIDTLNYEKICIGEINKSEYCLT